MGQALDAKRKVHATTARKRQKRSPGTRNKIYRVLRSWIMIHADLQFAARRVRKHENR